MKNKRIINGTKQFKKSTTKNKKIYFIFIEYSCPFLKKYYAY
jgi:hypothetical protein